VNTYDQFLASKQHTPSMAGFAPLWVPDEMFGYQRHLTEWNIRKGRSATFADCGLGKTIMNLTFAQNVVLHTNRPVLYLTPLAVGAQTVKEGEKFGVECVRSADGKFPSGAKVVVANYERLHYFDRNDFAGVVCDESGILKNYDGKTKAAVTDFLLKMPYRLLSTATAAPNDYVELGTSSEALGELGYHDMLTMFFRKENQKDHRGWGRLKFYMKAHATKDFWRWVCSWARAVRRPSDLGFSNEGFELPPLITREHVVSARTKRPGRLFDVPAETLEEQREERRRTLDERCEKVAELIGTGTDSAVAWCHLNDESERLADLIDGAVEVTGSQSDEVKEELLTAFATGQIRVIVTKSALAGFGLNWQHCHRETFFPSHSFEGWYQAVRRCWRFGQKHPVTVDVVTSEGECGVLENLKRKAAAADAMFESLVELMNSELRIQRSNPFTVKEKVPEWLSSIK